MVRMLLVALGLCLSATSVAAEAFPTRPITFVVPYAAGGTTDVLARIVGKEMSSILGQSVIIENVGGAGGTTGTLRVVKAVPDGYTLSSGNMGSLAASVPLYPRLGFDPRRDLAAVGVVARVPMVLAASNKSGIRDLRTFIDRLRAPGGQINIGQSGPGSTGHLAAARLLQLTGSKATLVAFRGAGPAINGLAGGFVDGVIDQTVTMIPVHQGNLVVGLAVSSRSRLSQIPGVPTFAEAGLPGFDLVVWNAVAAPKDTPETVIKALSKALDAALDSPEVQRRFADLAAEAPAADGRGPEELRSLIEAEVERMTTLIQASDIRVE